MTTEHVFDNSHFYQAKVKHEKHIWAKSNNNKPNQMKKNLILQMFACAYDYISQYPETEY